MQKRLLALVLSGFIAQGLHASEEVRAAAGFAFPSVQEGGSARAIALGSTYVGIAEGSAALLWNPAGLGTLLLPELSLHHNSALLGAIQEIAVLGLPMGAGNGLALSLNYEDNGVFEGRDTLGAPAAGYSARAYGASLGWGVALPAGLLLGAALKANRRDLAGDAANSYAGDLGILWNLYPQVSLGAAYNNFGPEVEGRQLAQGLRVGLSSYVQQNPNHEWLFSLSGETLTYGDSSLHFGMEHTFHKLFALRAGYALLLPKPLEGGLDGWSFGAGVLVKNLSIDYAIVPLAELGNMQRLSLTYVFGERPLIVDPAVTVPLTPAAVRQALKKVQGKSYMVKQGDSLWTISGKNKVLGDSFLWPLLFQGNGDQLSNPDEIEANQELKFKKKYSQQEVDDATKKAQDKPAYVR